MTKPSLRLAQAYAARPKTFCILALTAAIVVTFAPYLFTREPLVLSRAGEDIDHQFLAWRAYGFGELAAGRMPFWNPFTYGGQPYFAGFQSALLYPINWVHFFLPTNLAINVEVAANIWIAGATAFLWSTVLGLGAGAGLVTGLAFAFSGPVLACVIPGHLSNLAAMAWMPLVLLALDKLIVEGWSRRWVAIGAAAYALHLLGGHPQYAFYFGLIAAFYGLCRWLANPTRLWRRLIGAAAVPILGASLAAVQLIPGAFMLEETARAGGNYTFSSSFAFDPANLWLLLMPGKLGGLDGTVYHGVWNFWEEIPYFGMMALAFAVLSVIGRRRAWPLAAAMVAAVMLACGSQLRSLYDFLYQHLPFFAGFRGTSKFISIAALLGAAAAGQGFASLVTESGRLRARPARQIAVVLGGIVVLLGFEWLHEPVALATWTRGIELPIGVASGALVHSFFVSPRPLFELGLAVLALVIVTCFPRWRGAGPAMVLLMGIEISRFAAGVVSGHDVSGALAASARAATSDDALGAPRQNLAMNDGLLLRAPSLLGADPFALRRYLEVVAVSQGEDPATVDQEISIKRASPLLRLLRYRDERPLLPEIFMVHRYQVREAGAGVLAAIATPAFDPASEAILEAPPAVALAATPPVAATPRIEVLARSPGSLEAAVSASAPGILITSLPFTKGWQATLSTGEALPVVPVDHALAGLALPAGSTHVRFTYRPIGFSAGVAISLAAAAGLAALCLVPGRRGKPVPARMRRPRRNLPLYPWLPLAAGSGAVFLMISGLRSPKIPFPSDPVLGWSQPFRAQSSLHPFVLEAPPAAFVRGKTVVLGNQVVRASAVRANETFAAILGLFNAGLDETTIYQQLEVFQRYLAAEGPAGVLLVVTPEGLVSRAEAKLLQGDPERNILERGPTSALDRYHQSQTSPFTLGDLPPRVWADWSAAVSTLRERAGGHLAVIFLPPAAWLEAGRAPALGTELVGWCKSQGIAALDLTPDLLPHVQRAFARVAVQEAARRRRIHRILSPDGHRLVAERLGQLLGGSATATH